MRVLRTLIDHTTGEVTAVVEVVNVHQLYGAITEETAVKLSEQPREHAGRREPADLDAAAWSNSDLAAAIERRHKLAPGTVEVAAPVSESSE